jgi:hypothetical protein
MLPVSNKFCYPLVTSAAAAAVALYTVSRYK